jgi:hypothetical protein
MTRDEIIAFSERIRAKLLAPGGGDRRPISEADRKRFAELSETVGRPKEAHE